MNPERQLWLIEGLPGSGKSTTSDFLCTSARDNGWAAKWWLEELKDHPVLPVTLKMSARDVQFPRLCVQSFEDFLLRETGILILDGTALQSTVRYLYANAAPTSVIEKYIDEWTEAVRPYSPKMMMLTIPDPFEHYANFVRHLRGAEWTSKLIRYVESTPLAMVRQWSGFDGFVAFWSEYQATCLNILSKLPISVLSIEASPATASGLSSEIRTFFGLP